MLMLGHSFTSSNTSLFMRPTLPISVNNRLSCFPSGSACLFAELNGGIPRWCQGIVRGGYWHDNRGKGRNNHVITRAIDPWKEIIDPQSQRTYYWNTETNETVWEKPEAPVAVAVQRDNSEELTAARAKVGPEELLTILQDSIAADSSGMLFWETARSHRDDGVFEEEYFTWLDTQIAKAPDLEAKTKLQKLQARLSNPLLRQPAPFEF